MERNPCTGCRARCCMNTVGYVVPNTEKFLKAFPKAEKLNSQAELKEKVKIQDYGVYYFEDRDWLYFSISGMCPNVTPDGSCKIHEEEFYPGACLNMEAEGKSCNQAKELFEINAKITGSSFSV